MSELAVQGCTLSLTDPSLSVVNMAITTQPSQYTSVNGSSVYFGDITVALTTISQGSFTCPSGSVTISGTADSILEGTKKAVQKGDKGSAKMLFTESSSGNQKQITVEVEISNAGQTDVIAT